MAVIFSLPMVLGGLMFYLFAPQPSTWVELVDEYHQQQAAQAALLAQATPAVIAQVHPSNTGNAFEDGREDHALVESLISSDQSHGYRSGVMFVMIAGLHMTDEEIACDAVTPDPDFIQGCEDIKALHEPIEKRLQNDEEYNKGWDSVDTPTEKD